MQQIQDNLIRVQERIDQAAKQAGRKTETIKLLAVSKTVAVEKIKIACQAGQKRFGENRVQELIDKTPLLPSDCEWHLIGQLQQNKVRAAVQNAAWIHSVDSLRLLQKINRIAENAATPPQILLQVNISGESSKSGMAPERCEALLVESLSGLSPCRGLMTIAPLQADEAELHRIFAALRQLRDRLQASTGACLPELSMGMSGDLEAAIAEGATIVRVGSAIFGRR